MSSDHERRLIDRARRQARELRDRIGTTTAPWSESSRPEDIASESLPNYRLIDEIHRGGQGVVYRGVQLSSQREVAIKVMREGPFAAGADRARFEREIRVLGNIRHPNIVTIHDSGSSRGFYYYVMDYIAGSTLDAYIADARPDVDQTLRLFLKISNAVHAAHLRGAIHRDLKPGNIRVDAAGEPHVLDFGLARMTAEAGDAAEGALTETGQFVGSLPWSSPEQADGRLDEIDQRSDVYSLGMLLYQMLTGRFPYDISAGPRATMRNIAEADPVPPGRLRREINNELETIVLKCLAKERDRRYQSALDLSRDIERYFAGDAIEAKRDSTGYVLRKLFVRHKVPAISALALFMAAIGFGVRMSVLYRETDDAREREAIERAHAQASLLRANASEEEARNAATKATQVSNFLTGLFEQASPSKALGQDVTVRQMLDRGARLIQNELKEQPLVRSELQLTIGTAYTGLGLFDDARPHITAALETVQKQLGPDHPLFARCLIKLAILDTRQERYGDAEREFREAIKIQERLTGDSDHDLATSLSSLGALLSSTDRFDEARVLLSRAIEMLRKPVDANPTGPESADLVATLIHLAVMTSRQGDAQQAESIYREALAVHQKSGLGPTPNYSTILQDLAELVANRDDMDAAEQYMREALEVDRFIFGDSHPDLATTLNNLGSFQFQKGEFAQAQRSFEQALDIQKKFLGDQHADVASSLNNLASVLMQQGDMDGAARRLEEVVAIYKEKFGPEHSNVAVALNNLAALRRLQGRPSESAKYYREALDIYEKRFDESHPNLQTALAGLGMMLLKSGNAREAEPHLRRVIALRETASEPDPWQIALAKSTLGECLTAEGRYEEAEPLVVETYPLIEKERPGTNYAADALQRIIALYESWNKPDKAAEWRNRAANSTSSHDSN